MGTQLIQGQRTYSTPALNHQVHDTIRRLLSGSACDQSTRYKIALINMPTKEERGVLAGRQRELLSELRSHDRKEIATVISEMLASYDVARQRYKTKEELKLTVSKYVQEMDGVPTWAVAIACERIRVGSAPDISHAFEPTTIQLRVFACSIAEPFAAELSSISKIMAAEKWIEPVNEEIRARVLPKLRHLAEQMKMDRQLEHDKVRARNVAVALRKAAEVVERDFLAHGEELPQPLGGIVVSRFLKATIEEQEKARKALPPSEPMVL
jgi:hypothetical protein